MGKGRVPDWTRSLRLPVRWLNGLPSLSELAPLAKALSFTLPPLSTRGETISGVDMIWVGGGFRREWKGDKRIPMVCIPMISFFQDFFFHALSRRGPCVFCSLITLGALYGTRVHHGLGLGLHQGGWRSIQIFIISYNGRQNRKRPWSSLSSLTPAMNSHHLFTLRGIYIYIFNYRLIRN